MKRKRVVAIAPYSRPWSNVELIKDCGLIPYLLYREHSCDSVMVCSTPDADALPPSIYDSCDEDILSVYFPYYHLVSGEKFEFLPDGSVETKQQYIINYANDIDILILRGVYADNLTLPYIYKTLNPRGKIYCGLDMNTSWMRKIDWTNGAIVSYMDNTDLLATSCTRTAELMTSELPWNIKCIPNGSYNFNAKFNEYVDLDKRENIIITVGRLGTIQKATDILLLAFAIASPSLPSWKLELIGNVEESFMPVVNQIFSAFPDLREKVVFTGPINDRTALAREYRRAKIFALTSVLEGGTPNAAADAVSAGLATCITDIDASSDITDYGRCGLVSPIDDYEAFARSLITLCQSHELKQYSEHAYSYGKTFYNMSRIVNTIYDQL